MASTDAKAFPIKNQAYRVTLAILDADGDPVTGATGLDSEVSKDAGTFADCTNEATEIASASGVYYLDLTSTEMNADTVAVQVKTSTSGAKTTVLVFYPLEDADIRVNAVMWAGTANTTSDIAIKTTLAKTTHITGFNDISTANVQTELVTYGALKPTTSGRTLDVTTTGEAGIDLDNTAGTLAKGTDITGFNDIAAGAAMTLTSAYDAAKTASSQASVDAVKAVVDAIKVLEDHLATALELDGAVYRFTTNALEQAPTGTGSSPDTIADAILKRDWTAVSGEAAYSLLNACRMLRNVWNTTGGTLSVKKEDGSTNAWTRTLAVDPTAQPIVGAS